MIISNTNDTRYKNGYKVLLSVSCAYYTRSGFKLLRFHTVDLAGLHIVDVSSDWDVQDQRTFPQQVHIVHHALLQVAEWKECDVIGIFGEVLTDLSADVVIGEGEHAAARLSPLLARIFGCLSTASRTQLTWWITTISRVPRSCCEITIERIASIARPPALRMTCASPSINPSAFAGSIRASMHVTTATLLNERPNVGAPSALTSNVGKSARSECRGGQIGRLTDRAGAAGFPCRTLPHMLGWPIRTRRRQ